MKNFQFNISLLGLPKYLKYLILKYIKESLKNDKMFKNCWCKKCLKVI